MARIRYRAMDKEKTVLQSVQKFQHDSNGATYKVLLNLKENQFLVLDDKSDLIAASGHNTNLHKLKIAARKALNALGIPLEVDERQVKSKMTQVA